MPSGTGKTHQLILECHLHGGYIVCANLRESERIAQKAKELNLKIPLPITYLEFIKGQYGNVAPLHIDNVERLLQEISRVEIGTITLNPCNDNHI